MSWCFGCDVGATRLPRNRRLGRTVSGIELDSPGATGSISGDRWYSTAPASTHPIHEDVIGALGPGAPSACHSPARIAGRHAQAQAHQGFYDAFLANASVRKRGSDGDVRKSLKGWMGLLRVFWLCLDAARY